MPGIEGPVFLGKFHKRKFDGLEGDDKKESYRELLVDLVNAGVDIFKLKEKNMMDFGLKRKDWRYFNIELLRMWFVFGLFMFAKRCCMNSCGKTLLSRPTDYIRSTREFKSPIAN